LQRTALTAAMETAGRCRPCRRARAQRSRPGRAHRRRQQADADDRLQARVSSAMATHV
jgi:hypothetical protein